MGVNYSNLRDYNKAIECYKKTLELNPNNASIWINLGIAYGYLDDYTNKIECYKKALEIDPKCIKAWMYLGDTYYYYLMNIRDAIECYETVLKIDPKYAEAWESMSNIYDILQKYDKAAECYQKAMEIDPNYANDFRYKYINYKIRGEKIAQLKIKPSQLKALKQQHNWQGEGTQLSPYIIESTENLPDKILFNTGNLYITLKNLHHYEIKLYKCKNFTIENSTIYILRLYLCGNSIFRNNTFDNLELYKCKQNIFDNNKTSKGDLGNNIRQGPCIHSIITSQLQVFDDEYRKILVKKSLIKKKDLK